MPAIEVKPGIHWIGINDRTTDLFEGVWPIGREGISYNSYLVRDEKTALIDLAHGSQADSFVEQLSDVVNPGAIDYVVINHMEPDHTGAIRLLRYLAPQAEYLVTAKAAPMLAEFYDLREKVRVVEDGEELSLGEKTLRFYAIPFVHWPETMATYEVSERILFPCDAFGGYGALRGAIFDDQYEDMDFYLQESLRYYVNIVARFSRPVQMAIEKLGGVDIDIVAPSHGLIWRQDPMRIVSLYAEWASYARGDSPPGVTLVYGSMYGNTERMMNAVAEGVSRVDLPLEIFDAARDDVSYILPSLWVHSGVLVGAPTYEGALFPPMTHVLDMANHKRVLGKRAAYFGSWAWSGGGERAAKEITEKLHWDWQDALTFQGQPSLEDLHRGEDFGEAFAQSLIDA